MSVYFQKDKITGYYSPTFYPVKTQDDDKAIPSGILSDFSRLTSNIEYKYDKEYLKVCAFYNKLFPSLKSYDWSRSAYNTIPFTLQNQERMDTGTGIQANYLKAVVDMVVSRLGNTYFDYSVLAGQPTLIYAVYKDELTRVFKAVVRSFKLPAMMRSVFHDAAILAFSHVFVDPWTHKLRKVSDWALGCYESEFNEGRMKRVMIRDFAFPVSELKPYLAGFTKEDILEITEGRTQVDLRLYLDTFRRKKYVTVGNKTSAPTDYPFEHVQIKTYSWDIGIINSTVASLFDGLYPIQRALDKLLAKKTQLLSNYKGPVPIFNMDCDVIVKQLSNSTGEALFLDTSLKPADVVTVIEPTPLDPQLGAEVEALKAQMHELAGIQQVSMDIENYRSAAAVIALDQQRDTSFQSQVSSLAEFTRDVLVMYVDYCAATKVPMPYSERTGIDWGDIKLLFDESYLDVKPIHELKQDGGTMDTPTEPDYAMINVDKFLIAVIKDGVGLEKMDFSLDYVMVKQIAAVKLVRMKSITDLGESAFMMTNLTNFLVQCFVEDLKRGEASISG